MEHITDMLEHVSVSSDTFSIIESERLSESTASGDFGYIRDFTITNQKGEDLSGYSLYGYILQKITKSVKVEVPDAKEDEQSILTNTDDVMKYTDGIVNFMSDSYVEAFLVVKGRVIDADAFGNASILRYDKKTRTIAADAKDTKGVIIQTGDYYFVQSLNKTKQGILKELASMKIVVPSTKSLNPANGLPYSKDIELFEKLKSKRKSPIYRFSVSVEWDNDDTDSIVKPTKQIVLEGGKRRINRKTRKQRK
jgi:hypothetical protein